LAASALLLGCALKVCPANAATAETYLAHARAARLSLDRGWGAPGDDWTGINAWQRFVIVDILADDVRLSKDRAELKRLRRAVVNRQGLDGNDDDLWAALAALNVRALTHDDALLAFAEQTFNRITGQYWDQVCGGGLWWDHARTYKNAITNVLALAAAAQLYAATGKPGYLDWARREDQWISASGMINARGLLNDGLNDRCANNGGPTFTYNQGVYIGALTALSEATADPAYRLRAQAVAEAAVRWLSTPDGLLIEPGGAPTAQDVQIFKGVFIRQLGRLVAVMPDDPRRRALAAYLRHNADQVWRARGAGDRFSADWSGTATLQGAAPQAAAVALFDAAAEASPAP